MATSVPEIYGDAGDGAGGGLLRPIGADPGGDMLAHQRMHTIMLHAIHKQLVETSVPFRVQVPGGVAGGLAVPVMSAAKGEILTVQNPTAASLTVDLYENDGGNTVLRVTVAANDYKALYVPFFGRLFARAGAGMIISGHVTGD